jgi:hypothetical protein
MKPSCCRPSPGDAASFTFNVRDFVVLAQRYLRHGGIILAAQASWMLSDLIAALDRLLSETEAEDWIGQERWLNQ